jgi:hypothetical protein
MIRRVAVCAVPGLIAIVALAPAARAKEVVGATVCGATGCTSPSHPSAMLAQESQFFAPAPRPAPFFTVQVRMGFEGGPAGAFTRLWLPGNRLLAYRGDKGRLFFDRVDAPIAAAFRAVTRGGTPYPPVRAWREALRHPRPGGRG